MMITFIFRRIRCFFDLSHGPKAIKRFRVNKTYSFGSGPKVERQCDWCGEYFLCWE